MVIYSPDTYHARLLSTRERALTFHEDADYDTWKVAVSEKLEELLGDMPEEIVPLNLRVEWEQDYPDYIERRLVFDTEPTISVPCHLLIPKKAKKPCPVIICLQGHSTGMHVSMGRKKFARDEEVVGTNDDDFALQAIKEGYAALALEQRGFGERVSPKSIGRNPHYRTACYAPTMTALLLGRTMLGERIWDISRAIDMLETIPEIDSQRIACMGNSGGGTATYYAACIEERIKVAMPSCCVCTFEESIGALHHCVCNYLPNMAKYFDMGEIACMIAPRKLLVVAGMTDVGFLIKGSMDANKVIEKVYEKAGCPENVRFVIGEGGHKFYPDPAWKVFAELSGWKEE